MKKLISTTLLIAMFSTMAFCQTENTEADFKRHSIGSSLFLLGNIGDSSDSCN
jgi:hypothetical protein